MTNKLEEVLKELQESHVLVDREEYEKLLEKVKELESEVVKFEVGGYYFTLGKIFKILEIKNDGKFIEANIYVPERSHIELNWYFRVEWGVAKEARKATDEEIKLFKRAEMYHKHGRKLDELKMDDLIRDRRYTTEGEVFHIESTRELEECIEDLRLGEGIEIYLTLEEQEEAHKKIVGE